jgi:hypothetical protein
VEPTVSIPDDRGKSGTHLPNYKPPYTRRLLSWSHFNSCVFQQGRTSPATSSSSSCDCRCDCFTHRIRAPKIPLIRSDIVAGLVDNEHDKKRVQHESCERCSWLDGLNEFRQLHWFDCHAYHESDISRDATRSLDRSSSQSTSHKCMYVRNLSLLCVLCYRKSVHCPLSAWYWRFCSGYFCQIISPIHNIFHPFHGIGF